jgi:pentatricopeptide repeat protein
MSLPQHLAAGELLTALHGTGEILTALRGATCPSSAIRLYSLLRIRLRPSDPPCIAGRAAVFALKPLSAAASSLPLLSHFHAHLLRSNLLASPQVASSLLRSYSHHSPPAAHHLFDQMPPATCNMFAVNVMLSSLCRSSDLASARIFFDTIPDKDVVSWSTMLACYFSHGRVADGLAFFRAMTFATELTADFVMLVTVLTGCASAGLLPPHCKSIHGYIVRQRIPASMHLGTSLIDCYAKANRLDYACRVFARVPSRCVMHWTAMISGMAMHLRDDEAIRLFEEMRRRGVRPNEKTFTAVLTACGHAGLVEQGRLFFKLMVEEYDLEPSIHHYGCMVDIFAKAGQLEGAYDVIKTMRVEPNLIIWTSLLSACKRFRNFDIAVEGLEKVLAMEISDEDAGLYTLISDLYAMGGQWDGVVKVRRLMEEHIERKNRGLSSIKAAKPRSLTVPAVG